MTAPNLSADDEQRLASQAEAHRQLFEMSPELLCSIDESLHFQELNPAWERTLGWTRAELRDKPFVHFVHPDDVDESATTAQRLLRDGAESLGFEMRWLHRTGRWVRLTLRWTAKGNTIFATARDVSDYEANEAALVRAHAELREREAHLRALFESMGEGVILLDATGVATACNTAAERILKTPRSDLLGRNALQGSMVPLFDAAGAQLAEDERPGRVALKAGRSIINLIMGLDSVDGQRTWLSVNATPLRFHEGDEPRGVVITFRDKTEQRLLQAAQERSDARFRALVTFAPVGIFEAGVNGGCLYVNDRWCMLTGLSAAEALGDGWARALHPEDMPGVRQKWLAAASMGAPFTHDYRFLRPDGSEVFVLGNAVALRDDAGNVCGYLGTVVDISEQRRAELALAKSEANFRTIADRAPIGIGVRVGPVITYANPALARLHGVSSPDQLVGEHTTSMISPDSAEALARRTRALSRGDNVGAEVLSFRRVGDGTEALLEVDSLNLEFGGQPAVMSLLRDVTELERARTERDVAHAALVESLSQKETLLKEIHHRVKNNLQVIASLLRLGKGNVRDPIALGAFNDSIARVHSIALIHERLYQSRDLDRVDLRRYLSGLVNEIARTYLTPMRTVEVVVESADVRLDIDRCVPLGLIVNELVTNALKHAFVAPRAARQARVTVQLREHDLEFELAVTDNGVGFDQSEKAAGSLGLVLVVNLAQQLGGSTSMMNEEGTTWRIRFPKPM